MPFAEEAFLNSGPCDAINAGIAFEFQRCPRAFWYGQHLVQTAGPGQSDATMRFAQLCRLQVRDVLANQAHLLEWPEGTTFELVEPGQTAGGLEAHVDGVLKDAWGHVAGIVIASPGRGARESIITEAAFGCLVWNMLTQFSGLCLAVQPSASASRTPEGSWVGDTLILRDLTREAWERANVLPAIIEKIRKCRELPAAPDVELRLDCIKAGLCEAQKHCDQAMVLEDGLTTLNGGHKDLPELLEKGIRRVRDIPDSVPLTRTQTIQREAERRDSVWFDGPSLSRFLSKLRYPLSFLDFETFSLPLPAFSGMASWKHTPYLYSLHVVRERGAKPVHHHWMGDEASNPAGTMLVELRRQLPTSGSIVVFDRAIEGRLLANLFSFWPALGKEASTIQERIVDLHEPFGSFSCYHPGQHGRTNLKTLAAVWKLGIYEGLSIGGGADAGAVWGTRVLCRQLGLEAPPGRDEERKALLEYCSKDTLVLIELLELLERSASGGQRWVHAVA